MAAPIPPRQLTNAERASVTGEKLVDNLRHAARRLASKDPRTIEDVGATLHMLARRLELLQQTPDEPAVCRYLDVSTAHLPDAEAAAITDHFAAYDGSTPIVCDHSYGWWLHVADDLTELPADFVSACPATVRILRTARALGCRWVNLDADAEVHPQLPLADTEARRGPALAPRRL